MKKVVVVFLTVFIFACSQNAHLTQPDTIEVNNALSQKPTETAPIPKMKIVLSDHDQNNILFSGTFTGKGLLSEGQLIEFDSDSKYRWDEISKFFKGFIDGDLTVLNFEKVLWAKELGQSYRLFDISENFILPENSRGKAHTIILSIAQSLPNQPTQTRVVIYPIQYRYAIDDEALSQGKFGIKNDVFYTQGLVTGRYVRGLEYVSNRNLLYRNINCSKGYDFIDTYVYSGRNNFKARVIARRDTNGIWKPLIQPYSTLLGAVGFGLTQQRSAYFSDVLSYGGNCTFKVQGLMSVNALTLEAIDGLRVELIAQNGEMGFADFGVTILEAY